MPFNTTSVWSEPQTSVSDLLRLVRCGGFYSTGHIGAALGHTSGITRKGGPFPEHQDQFVSNRKPSEKLLVSSVSP